MKTLRQIAFIMYVSQHRNGCCTLALQELVAGRGGARSKANRERRQRRSAAGSESPEDIMHNSTTTTTSSATTTTTTTTCMTGDSAAGLVGGVLGELGYTGEGKLLVSTSIVLYDEMLQG
jgi:hypothetical protein